jgi:2-oxoisovalerate dehydrogenase E1 component alpha subunit
VILNAVAKIALFVISEKVRDDDFLRGRLMADRSYLGAASEGDFHAGLLLASTIPSPTLFIVRNNGFAISTPSAEQYYGDGIAARGPGYGIDTIRVDGNDVLAVLAAVREGRQRCVAQGRAVLVESMTYRVGHHSTSDDSFAYRARQEVETRKKVDNPLERLKNYMMGRKWWTQEEDDEVKARHKREVLEAFKRAEGLKRWDLKHLFTDVYGGEMPWNLVSLSGLNIDNLLLINWNRKSNKPN